MLLVKPRLQDLLSRGCVANETNENDMKMQRPPREKGSAALLLMHLLSAVVMLLMLTVLFPRDLQRPPLEKARSGAHWRMLADGSADAATCGSSVLSRGFA